MSAAETAPFEDSLANTLLFRRERPLDYRAAFERAMTSLRRYQGLLHQQPRMAPHLLSELSPYNQAQRQRMVAADSRFHHLEVCDGLAEHSLRLVPHQPEEALGLAELALAIAEQLRSPCGSEGLARDLQARCWASLANAHRALGDSPRALEAFRRAGSHLEAGSGDPLEEGQLSELEALLLGGLGQLDAAERLLDGQIASYRGFEQQAALVRTQAHKAALHARQGRFERAAEQCREALYGLDWYRERALALELRRQLVALLDVLGNDLRIRRELQQSRVLDNDGPGGWSDSERLRLAGRGEARARNYRAARDLLERASTRLLAQKHLAEALRVCLDLTALFIERGGTDDFARLRGDLARISSSPNLEGPLAAVISGHLRVLSKGTPSPEQVYKLRQDLTLVVCDPERTFLLGL